MQIFIIKTRCSVDAVYFQIVNHEIIISPSKIPRMYFILHRRVKRIIYPHTCKMVLRFAMKAGCVISRRKTGSSFFSFFLFSQIFFFTEKKISNPSSRNPNGYLQYNTYIPMVGGWGGGGGGFLPDTIHG